MPIVAIGTDLARIERLAGAWERRGDRLLERLFTAAEREYCERRPRTRFAHYAGRFAVKEAVMKALGTGWRSGVRWVDIETLRDPGQAPRLRLHGACARHAERQGIARIHISITHDGGMAMAVAVAESD